MTNVVAGRATPRDRPAGGVSVAAAVAAHAVLGQLEHLREEMSYEVRHLRAGPQRQLAVGRVPVGDTAAGFHRGRHLAIRPKRALDDDPRLRQGRVDVAALEATGEER